MSDNEGGYLIPAFVDADKEGRIWAIVRRLGMWIYKRGRYKYDDMYAAITGIKTGEFAEHKVVINCSTPGKTLSEELKEELARWHK